MTARNDFDGTVISNIINTTGTIADGNFSVSGTNATVVEFDNTAAADNWTNAKLTLTATMAADPGDSKVISIYRYETEIDGTSGHDVTAPELAEVNGGEYIGYFLVPDGTAVFYANAIISLIGVKKCKFSLYNDTGQTISSGATLDIEGFGLNDS